MVQTDTTRVGRMPSRSSAHDDMEWRGDSRRRTSRYYQQRPREAVDLEEREGPSRPRYLLSSNVWVRPGLEQPHNASSPSICLQIFHGKERPSNAYERTNGDVPRQEASAESPSFGQWISPPYRGGRREQWRGYNNERTESHSFKRTRWSRPRRRGNYRDYNSRRESSYDEFSSVERYDDSKEDTPYIPEYRQDFRNKHRHRVADPPEADEDVSFGMPPGFSSKRWDGNHSPGRNSASKFAQISRTAWLRDTSLSVNGSEIHASADERMYSEDVSFSAQPVTNHRNSGLKTDFSPLVPAASQNEFPQPEAEDQQGHREQPRGHGSGRPESWNSTSKRNLGTHPPPRRNYNRRPFLRQDSFQKEYLTFENLDDSKQDAPRVPERLSHSQLKPTLEVSDTPSSCTKKSDCHDPPSSGEKICSDVDNGSEKPVADPAVANRTTWLASCAAKGLENPSSGEKPVADDGNDDAKTASKSFATVAASPGFPKTEPEIHEVAISKEADDDAVARHVDERLYCGNLRGSAMGEFSFNASVKVEDELRSVMLVKDNKLICRTLCGIPLELPFNWNVAQFISTRRVECLPQLARFPMHPAYEDSYQRKEWGRFMHFLLTQKKIAVAKFEKYEIYILPPDGSQSIDPDENSLTVSTAKVAYRERASHRPCTGDIQLVPVAKDNFTGEAPQRAGDRCEVDEDTKGRMTSSTREAAVTIEHGMDALAFESDASVKPSSSGCGVCPAVSRCLEVVAESNVDAVQSLQPIAMKNNFAERNFVRTDPSYLKTLGQSHSSWIFGAIAEFVDNARDAEAKKLNISMETIYYKKACGEIPVLSIIDDGHGMTHQEICRMVSFGHKQPEGDDAERIGRFGIGFKTGAMRLGKDALVLTQTAESRSIAFLSQSLNEGRDNLEIPIVSYRRQGQYMELDKEVQSEELADYNLNAIKEFSPFNEYLIGEKAANFRESSTGTQIYVWNLDKWGSDYCLEWQTGKRGGSSFYQGDIFIRSRRVRSRPGQTSRKVPLDYSLKAYLEVIFLDPRMKIYVQDSLVKSRPLAKSLGKTMVIAGIIMGKAVQLTLGRCQLEWEQANGGIFLYWHGRLIEAYKRVGGMLHNVDIGRGVLGVIDVTNLMDDGSGCVYVHNNKQGFQDCEQYALLEEWLADRLNEYWDTEVDKLEVEKRDTGYVPDRDWVQCDKCRKWRTLRPDFDRRRLPQEWFCYMEPFNGKCDMPEQMVGDGVITVSAKRGRYDSNQAPEKNTEETNCEKANSKPAGDGYDVSSQNMETEENGEDVEAELKAPLKRLRRGGSARKYS